MAILGKVNQNYVLKGLQLSQANDMLLDVGEVLEVEVRLVDSREISEQQRKFIFALCNEISYDTGYDSEYARLLVQQYNANLRDIEVESLSSCSMTYANGLIDTIINFCIEQEIPFARKLIEENKYSFTAKQIYAMTLKRVCCVCGMRADIHHVDAVGMGRNRRKIDHTGLRVLPLCRNHHTETHQIGNDSFIERYHLEPITVDEKMNLFIRKGVLRVYEETEEQIQ